MTQKIAWEKYLNINQKLLNLLLENPLEYYNKLEHYKTTYGYDFIKKIINISTHEIYCGNHLHALVMITGNLIFDVPDYKKIWGINKSLDDSFASKICKKLLDYGINYSQVDYHDRTPYQNILLKDNYSSRYNNKTLKKTIQQFIINDLNKNFNFKTQNSNQFKKKVRFNTNN